MKRPADGESVLLVVRAQPRSAVSRLDGWRDGALRVRVTAPPVEDAANRAVLDLLAHALGAPRSALSLVRGARGRDKLVRISGVSRDLLAAKLGVPRTLE
jgi:hypothetical protein